MVVFEWSVVFSQGVSSSTRLAPRYGPISSPSPPAQANDDHPWIFTAHPKTLWEVQPRVKNTFHSSGLPYSVWAARHAASTCSVRLGATHYQERGFAKAQTRVESSAARFRELTLQPIQDELIQLKRELENEQCTLTDSEVLAEVA